MLENDGNQSVLKAKLLVFWTTATFGLQACLMLFSFGHLFQEPFTSKQTAPSPPFFLPSQREAMYFNKGHIILKWSVTIQREEEWVRVRVRGRCFTNWPGENILQSKLSSKYWGTYYITGLTPRSPPFFFFVCIQHMQWIIHINLWQVFSNGNWMDCIATHLWTLVWTDHSLYKTTNMILWIFKLWYFR